MHARAANPVSKFDGWLVASYAGALVIAFLGTTQRGLWEDGYFVKRFAYNFWHHGSFSWNPSDGPVYGMTSQLLQLLGTLIYAIAPQHCVLVLKAALYLAALATLWVIGRTASREAQAAGTFVPACVGLSLPLILEVAQSGLETLIGLLVVAVSARDALAFGRGECSRLRMAASTWLVYVTRPDAVLVPLLLLAGLSLRPSEQDPQRRGRLDLRPLLWTLALIGAGLGGLLLAFRVYYGTALPLPFYIKTHALAAQAQLDPALFRAEKTKNASQAAFFALPFVYIALHRRSTEVGVLLGSAAALAAYHYFGTVETMGQLSRFYLPAFVPIWLAAATAYPGFLAARRRSLMAVCAFALYLAVFSVLQRVDQRYGVALMLDGWRFYPFMLACAIMLIAPGANAAPSALLIGVTLIAGALLSYPVRTLRFEDDESILLRQIAPRRVFRGLPRLRERLTVHTLFHTDMGAPGVLFPEARVVDLDGLLNEDVTLRHLSFETLCQSDHPEAIFVPSPGYARLRLEVLRSQCLRDYRSADRRSEAPHLMIRKDLLSSYARAPQ